MKFKNKLITNLSLTLLITFSLATSAVDYSEFASMPMSANDGLSFDLEGNLYVSNIGGNLSGEKYIK